MYSLARDFLQPFPVLLLWTIVAAVLIRRKPPSRQRWRWLFVPVILLLFTSTPIAAFLASGTLEWFYPPLRERPADADVIVVLSGYYYAVDAEGERFELGTDTLQRCLKAAELYRQSESPCRILVSGGVFSGEENAPSCARVMKDWLMKMGVKESDILVEDQSRSTHENAVESSKILHREKIEKMVLVTDAVHLWRATGCFHKEGVEVVPCGCGYQSNSLDWSPAMFLPNVHSARSFQEAYHEWLGLVWYRSRGWI
jgi:uncharacterized SAM-binding protein YcdF (DUF218 family)